MEYKIIASNDVNELSPYNHPKSKYFGDELGFLLVDLKFETFTTLFRILQERKLGQRGELPVDISKRISDADISKVIDIATRVYVKENDDNSDVNLVRKYAEEAYVATVLTFKNQDDLRTKMNSDIELIWKTLHYPSLVAFVKDTGYIDFQLDDSLQIIATGSKDGIAMKADKDEKAIILAFEERQYQREFLATNPHGN